MEIQASGKDIGARQSLERKLGTVRTSTDSLHGRFHPGFLHSLGSNINDVHDGLNLFAHVVVLVMKFKHSDSFTILGIDFTYQGFHQPKGQPRAPKSAGQAKPQKETPQKARPAKAAPQNRDLPDTPQHTTPNASPNTSPESEDTPFATPDGAPYGDIDNV